MKYEILLKNAPEHDSPEFLDYLKKNNVVIKETKHWLIIENVKYHSPENPWYTAFAKKKNKYAANYMWEFTKKYYNWQWLKKNKDKQMVQRFHVHLVKNI